jgi:hypothetical protein
MTKNPPVIAFAYKKLYCQSPKLARETLLDFIHNNPSLSKAQIARVCKCSRTTVYDVLKRDKLRSQARNKDSNCTPNHSDSNSNLVPNPTDLLQDSALENKSTKPLSNPNKTPVEIEELVVKMRQETNFGSRRITAEIARDRGIKIHKNTVYKILKRNGLNFRKRRLSKNNDLRDYYQSPFRFIEIDIKEVKDTKALPKEVYEHVDKYNLPNYQFTATDTFTRMRWLSYGYEKSFTNGFGFLYYILIQLRQAGVTDEIRFQTDNGQEFGGFEEKKIKQLDEELQLFNSRFIHIPKAQKHKQGHVERSHRTDDEELYIPYLTTATDTKSFVELAIKWVWYFNVKRPHQGKYLNDNSPFEYAKRLQDEGYEKEVKASELIDGKEVVKLDENGYEMTKKERFYLPNRVNLDKLKLVPVLLLDNVSVELMFYYNKMLNLLKKKKSQSIQNTLQSISKESYQVNSWVNDSINHMVEINSKSVQDVCGYYLAMFSLCYPLNYHTQRLTFSLSKIFCIVKFF